MARGRTPPNRQSFRGCPNVISFCLLMGCKGRFDGACGRLPVWDHTGKTRQIAFVARYAKPVVLRRGQGFTLMTVSVATAGAATATVLAAFGALGFLAFFAGLSAFAGLAALVGFLATSAGAFSARSATTFLLPSLVRALIAATCVARGRFLPSSQWLTVKVATPRSAANPFWEMPYFLRN